MGLAWTPLERILTEPQREPACFSPLEPSGTWGQWLGPLVGQLQQSPPGGWILFAEDTAQFALGLLALWACGRPALLPPNDGAATLSDLAPQAVGFLGDAPRLLDLPFIDLSQARPGPALGPCTLDLNQEAAVLYTSGSTGEPKAVPKRLGQLAAEVSALEQRFGADLGEGAVYSTVSHQHIYGLLFRLLWPLCAGRPWARRAHFYPEELVAQLKPGSVLISGPAHLKRIPQLIDLAQLKPFELQIFSSGGPLPTDTALEYAQVLGRAPSEVYGSTETGGIATRQVRLEAPQPLWQALPEVQLGLSPQGRLEVRSPFAGPELRETGDLARLEPKGFALLGRGDRIVKFEEKRLSLPEIEARLEALESVEKAWVSVFGSPRQRLGAALELSPAGWAQLAQEGRKGLSKTLQNSLKGHYDALLVPRRFEFFEAFPLTAQGKIDRAALLEAFEAPKWPHRLGFEVLGESFRWKLQVPHGLLWTQGHFEGDPLVPGVASLHWVHHFLSERLKAPVLSKEVKRLKFLRPLKPGQVFWLELHPEKEEQWGFELYFGEECFASGSLILDR